MKKRKLLNILAVFTLFLLNGCFNNSNSDATNGVGFSNPIVLNSVSAKKVLGLLQSTALGKVVIKNEKQHYNAVESDENETRVDMCSIEGNITYNKVGMTETDENGTKIVEITATVTYNNCIDEISNPINSRLYNRKIRSGVKIEKEYHREKRDNDNIFHSGTRFLKTDIIEILENNKTLEAKTYRYDLNQTGKYKEFLLEKEEGFRYSTMIDGMRKYEIREANGTISEKHEVIYDNFSEDYEVIENLMIGIRNIIRDGTYTRNDTDRESESQYYENFVVKESKQRDENQTKITMYGVLGNSCIGGNVKINTMVTVEKDAINYFDGDGNTGHEVLPFVGSLVFIGKESRATVTYAADDTNHTSATVNVGEGEEDVYTKSSDLNDHDCRLR